MRTERAPSPFSSLFLSRPPRRQENGRGQGPRIRRRQEEGRDRRLSAPGLQRAPRLRNKRFSSRGNRGTEEGRTMVEGDGKGGVVVIGSKEDTYWTLSGVFITPFSRARRFKCFWLCLKARVHPPPPSLAPPFSPLSHYTPLTGYASFYPSPFPPRIALLFLYRKIFTGSTSLHAAS